MVQTTNNLPIDPDQRRPVGSRRWPVIQWLGDAIARQGISPNTVSVLSMVFATLGSAMMVLASHTEGFAFRGLCLAAIVCIQLRLLANVLDGIVAERSGKASLAGRLYNEWPDRISDSLLLIGFGWFVIDPANRFLGPLAACAAVMTAYSRELGRAIGVTSLFLGPLAKPQRMALLTALLVVMVIWPDVVHRPFGGPASTFGLAEAGLWTFILGGLITLARRLWALHRIASTTLGDGHDND